MASKTKVSNGSKTSLKATGSKQSVSSSRTSKEEEKVSLIYKILPAEETKEFIEACDVDHLQQLVCKFLCLDDTEYSLKQSVMIDLYVAGVWWCREQNFTSEQTSAFYTVLDRLLKNIEKCMTVTDNLLELKRIFAGIGVECPENCGGLQDVFDISEATSILDYFNVSIFQHYLLIEFYFQEDQQVHINGQNLELEVPLSAMTIWPPPLDEGMNEADHHLYIDEQQQEPLTEEQERTEEEKKADKKLEEDILARMDPEEVKQIIDGVFAEMLSGLEVEVAEKLHHKKNDFLNRINVLHVVDATTTVQTKEK